jgi:GtrA-like protein
LKSPDSAPSSVKQKIMGLDERYHVFKLAKFAIASGTGFLVSEALLALGLLGLYGKLSAPKDAYSSPTFLVLDIGVLAFGVFVAFILNERFTVQVHQTRKNGKSRGRPARLLKFEGVNAMGNAVSIGVQFVLLAMLSVEPVVGSVVGAIVSYPVTYLISMRFVWTPTASGPAGKSLMHHRDQQPKRGGPLSPPVKAIVFLVSLYVVSRALGRRERLQAHRDAELPRPMRVEQRTQFFKDGASPSKLDPPLLADIEEEG